MQKIWDEMKRDNSEALEKVNGTMREIKQSQSFLSGKFDDLITELHTLKTNQKNLRTDVDDVKGQYSTLRGTVDQLEIELDRLHRVSLAKNAMLLGVPVMKEENVKEVVNRIATAIKCDLPAGAVVDAMRVINSKTQGRTPPIRVVFADAQLKEMFFECKKAVGPLGSNTLGENYAAAKGRIIVTDELTKHGLDLLRETRAAQEKFNFKYVWPGRDGVILVKKTQDSAIEKVKNHSDIQKLGGAFKRNHNSSLNRSTSGSSFEESSPKRRDNRQQ